jgi:hypothetical protein
LAILAFPETDHGCHRLGDGFEDRSSRSNGGSDTREGRLLEHRLGGRDCFFSEWPNYGFDHLADRLGCRRYRLIQSRLDSRERLREGRFDR